ncbi:SatD family protein [uncultured Microbacterium sp.]|uniref:SatD family protein n=1 Tax=uncultured Microbacterium sp. TaxID=191216 RepID=UPI0026321243|nr:SatD family protein [uncultured Microbacterium sp.]
MLTVVTADIIGSREIADRSAAQKVFDASIARVEQALPVVVRGLRPTVGDEQQGVYPTLEAALATILLLRLALPDGLEFRYGIGLGEIGRVASVGIEQGIADGPGWWAARTAVEHVEKLQRRDAPNARSWVVADEKTAKTDAAAVNWANAYLLARDEIVSTMTARSRRLTYGRCLGEPQRELARAEGITQSAVSQALASSGASAIVAGFRMLAVA